MKTGTLWILRLAIGVCFLGFLLIRWQFPELVFSQELHRRYSDLGWILREVVHLKWALPKKGLQWILLILDVIYTFTWGGIFTLLNSSLGYKRPQNVIFGEIPLYLVISKIASEICLYFPGVGVSLFLTTRLFLPALLHQLFYGTSLIQALWAVFAPSVLFFLAIGSLLFMSAAL